MYCFICAMYGASMQQRGRCWWGTWEGVVTLVGWCCSAAGLWREACRTDPPW